MAETTPTTRREDVLALFDLTDRVAIVTGGTRGIGLAAAQGLTAMGAKVVVASRKADAVEAVAGALREDGAAALGVPVHMGDLDSIAHLVSATLEHFGGIDIVVNNAANALALPIGGITADAWAKTQDTNERGPLFLVQEALEALTRSEHASVINMVSAGVFTSGGHVAMYTAAKAGLLALTRSMAAELAPRGIRVNAVAPGPIDTDMMRNNDPAVQAHMAKATLMNRMAEPEEMVGPIVFLASEASSYMTGQVIVPDGGLTFH
jgi:NAD(P)-dependent dehydrogenase (short-subunit alcohol dehydrogenase family)